MSGTKTVILGGGVIRSTSNEELVAKIMRVKALLAEEAEEVWVEEQDFCEEHRHGKE
jgi:hypothetical protein